MEEKITLGRFIAKKRKEVNLTQRDLAEKLYVTESAVSKWERGLSYPDISLITSICQALSVTEHELITASEDFRQRKIEKQAKSYYSFIKGYKWVGVTLYGLALLTCFICNLSIQHTLSWFFVVLTAEMIAFSLTTLPAFLTKNHLLILLGSFFASLNLLLLTCVLLYGGDWFFITFISLVFGFSVVFLPFVLKAIPLPSGVSSHQTLLCFGIDTVLLFVLLFASCTLESFFTVACPSALFTLLLPWTLMVIIRYAKINGLFKGSACLLFVGIYAPFFNNVIRAITDGRAFAFIDEVNLLDWSQRYITGNVLLTISLSCIMLAILFVAGGIALTVKQHNKK